MSQGARLITGQQKSSPVGEGGEEAVTLVMEIFHISELHLTKHIQKINNHIKL